MDFFKKKNKTQAPTKVATPKKSLFAKKSKIDAIQEPKIAAQKSAPKRLLFTKKASPKEAKIAVKPKLGNKNLPILLGAVLGLLGLGLAAKMFLFAEPEVVPSAPSAAPVAAVEEAPPPAEATQPSEQPAVDVAQAPPPVAQEQVVQQATQSQNDSQILEQPVTTAAPQATEEVKISYEDFVKQSQSRVYRERSTEPNADANEKSQ